MQAEQAVWHKQMSERCKRTNGQASDSVLSSGFLVVLDHSALVPRYCEYVVSHVVVGRKRAERHVCFPLSDNLFSFAHVPRSCSCHEPTFA